MIFMPRRVPSTTRLVARNPRLLCLRGSRPASFVVLIGTIAAGSVASSVQADAATADTSATDAASTITKSISNSRLSLSTPANPNRVEHSALQDAMPHLTSESASLQSDPPMQAEIESLDARLAKRGMKADFDLESIMQKHGLNFAAPNCQLGLVPRPFPIALRLGAAVSPRTKFVGGLDVTIPSLSLGKGFTTRIDVDAIVSANFGGVTTLVPLTFDQVYRVSLPGGAGIYFGGGIGPYFGEVTRFGGKLFIGGEISPRFGLEGTIHFQGAGDAIATVQARFPF